MELQSGPEDKLMVDWLGAETFSRKRPRPRRKVVMRLLRPFSRQNYINSMGTGFGSMTIQNIR